MNSRPFLPRWSAPVRPWAARLFVPLLAVCWVLMPPGASGQLFTNLNSLVKRLPSGDPTVDATDSAEGPKGLCTADFNDDGLADLAIGNTDGTVTLYYGGVDGAFEAPVHLQTGVQELRGVVCGDLTGDGRPDIVAASPYAGATFLFVNHNGQFTSPVELTTWPGARNLAVGDFDGDLRDDLLVAGTTNGVRQLRSLGEGMFEVVTNLTVLAAPEFQYYFEFPKPVYPMASFRLAGADRDQVVVTHADGNVVWVLGAGEDGALAVQASLTSARIHSLAVGAVTRPATDGVFDLVLASRDRGTVEIHAGVDSPARFEEAITQQIEVPGGPRAVEIVDMDGDGWNEVVVVLRNFDRLVVYGNSNGVLTATEEVAVGVSPRELVSADFDGDGSPDVAVMNRDSMDVSILTAFPGEAGFGVSDLTYPVDGEVSGLGVFDFNDDGRDDVMQLHRASGEFSIRLALPNGRLTQPTFYPIGSLPSAQAAVDVNNDGIRDLVSANLGRDSYGSVTVRLGDGLGGFGEPVEFYLPEDQRGGLFALVAADFDNDGNADLAAGFFDCRLAFFRGFGDGTFEYTTQHRFVVESRVMVAGDFDQDGDTDLAGAGYAGHVVVIENKGDLLTTPELTRYDYPPPGKDKFGTKDILLTDLNGDGDPDLVVGSGNGTMLFFGEEGMAFRRVSDGLPGTRFPNGSVALGDFDDDGLEDLAVSCRLLSCISILVQVAGGEYTPAVTVNVPSGQFLATGDLDGDGKDDLVGTGGVLWTALSSRRGEVGPPQGLPPKGRRGLGTPVINELLAVNTDWPLGLDEDRTSDWVEFYNDSTNAVSLNGWKLQLVETAENGAPVTNEFAFPPTAFFPSERHLTVVCSETKRTVYHTGFRLPGSGGTLRLIDASGEEVDRVDYPAQLENVAYARYGDGLPALAANPYPSPGRANRDNGPVDPAVEIEELDIQNIVPNQPIRFAVMARDDIGVIGMSLVYQRMDVPGSRPTRVILFDDGEHDDGGVVDGLFAGVLPEGLPAGAEIQFYVEAIDLSDRVVVEPDEPVFGSAGAGEGLFSMALEVPVPSLEISELVASNLEGLTDEAGNRPDWVEIRNCSGETVPLEGVQLGGRFFGTRSRYRFAGGDVLLPGEHRVVFCDNQPDLGTRHAPFELNRDGDRVVLTGRTANGVRTLIDEVAFGVQATDVALARLGCDGIFRSEAPTPEGPNVPGDLVGVVNRAGGQFSVAFPTRTNKTYVVEYTDALGNEVWMESPPVVGDGIEHVLTQWLESRRYYRVREEDAP